MRKSFETDPDLKTQWVGGAFHEEHLAHINWKARNGEGDPEPDPDPDSDPDSDPSSIEDEDIKYLETLSGLFHCLGYDADIDNALCKKLRNTAEAVYQLTVCSGRRTVGGLMDQDSQILAVCGQCDRSKIDVEKVKGKIRTEMETALSDVLLLTEEEKVVQQAQHSPDYSKKAKGNKSSATLRMRKYRKRKKVDKLVGDFAWFTINY